MSEMPFINTMEDKDWRLPDRISLYDLVTFLCILHFSALFRIIGPTIGENARACGDKPMFDLKR